MKNLIPSFIYVLILAVLPVHADSYLGIGSFKSEFLGTEYDRSYESDLNTIRQLKFGYSDKHYMELFGGVNLDTDNKISDYALGLALEDKLIRIESGSISGQIVHEDGPTIGSFDNTFLRIDLLNKEIGADDFLWGYSFQKYGVPHLFQYNDGSTTGIHIQDDDFTITAIGIGIFYDPIHNFLIAGKNGGHSDWYFATSTVGISLALAQSSDAPELAALGVDNKKWLLWGNSGTYELGWLFGYKNADISVVANIGYHIRANTWLNANLAEMFEIDPPPEDINIIISQLWLHGIVSGLTVSF